GVVAALVGGPDGHGGAAGADGAGGQGRACRAVVRGAGSGDGGRFGSGDCWVTGVDAALSHPRLVVGDARAVGDVGLVAALVAGPAGHGGAAVADGAGGQGRACRAVVRGAGRGDGGRFGSCDCWVTGVDAAFGHHRLGVIAARAVGDFGVVAALVSGSNGHGGAAGTNGAGSECRACGAVV